MNPQNHQQFVHVESKLLDESNANPGKRNKQVIELNGHGDTLIGFSKPAILHVGPHTQMECTLRHHDKNWYTFTPANIGLCMYKLPGMSCWAELLLDENDDQQQKSYPFLAQFVIVGYEERGMLKDVKCMYAQSLAFSFGVKATRKKIAMLFGRNVNDEYLFSTLSSTMWVGTNVFMSETGYGGLLLPDEVTNALLSEQCVALDKRCVGGFNNASGGGGGDEHCKIMMHILLSFVESAVCRTAHCDIVSNMSIERYWNPFIFADGATLMTKTWPIDDFVMMKICDVASRVGYYELKDRICVGLNTDTWVKLRTGQPLSTLETVILMRRALWIEKEPGMMIHIY